MNRTMNRTMNRVRKEKKGVQFFDPTVKRNPKSSSESPHGKRETAVHLLLIGIHIRGHKRHSRLDKAERQVQMNNTMLTVSGLQEKAG